MVEEQFQLSSEDNSPKVSLDEVVRHVTDNDHNNPYDILGLAPDSSWEDIQKKITELQGAFKDAKVTDLPGVSIDEAHKRVDAQSKLKWAIIALQEIHFQREEFLTEAQDLPTLLRRLEILTDHGVSFLANTDSLGSVAGARGQILNLMRDVYQTPTIKLFPHHFMMISDLHNERSLFESELPKFRELITKLKTADDVVSINRALQALKLYGYEKLPTWKDGKPAFLSVTEELLRIRIQQSADFQKRGEAFQNAFVSSLKKRIGLETA